MFFSKPPVLMLTKLKHWVQDKLIISGKEELIFGVIWWNDQNIQMTQKCHKIPESGAYVTWINEIVNLTFKDCGHFIYLLALKHVTIFFNNLFSKNKWMRKHDCLTNLKDHTKGQGNIVLEVENTQLHKMPSITSMTYTQKNKLNNRINVNFD